MNSEDRRKHRRRSPKSSKNLLRKIRKKLKRFLYAESVPREYRPFLGPDASKEEVDRLKFKNTRVNLYKRPKKQKKNKRSLFELLAEKLLDWKKPAAVPVRKKQKHKIQRSIN